MSAHEPTTCAREGLGFYSFRNWSMDFRCPTCSRVGRFNLNFLGARRVVCDGVRFVKVPA